MSMQWHGGKGSKQRTSDYAAYTENYDKIFEKKKGKEKLTEDVCELFKNDLIEWMEVDSETVEILIVDECGTRLFSHPMDSRIGLTFTVPINIFKEKYQPAFKDVS